MLVPVNRDRWTSYSLKSENMEDEKSRSKKSRVEKKLEIKQKLISSCKEPRMLQEISEYLDFSDKYRMKRIYIDPLLEIELTMTSVESKTYPKQKYVVKNIK